MLVVGGFGGGRHRGCEVANFGLSVLFLHESVMLVLWGLFVYLSPSYA